MTTTQHRIPLAGPRVTTDTDDQLGYHPFYGDEGEPHGRYEVWHRDDPSWGDVAQCEHDADEGPCDHCQEGGYFWAAGFAGCLHDGEPSGPFPSSRAARDDADPSWREAEGDTSQPDATTADALPIILMDDQPPTCGDCGRRVTLASEPYSADEDGPIYLGTCPVHGARRYQDDTEEDAQ